MKKTIVALMALAGMALGAEDDTILTLSGVTFGANQLTTSPDKNYNMNLVGTGTYMTWYMQFDCTVNSAQPDPVKLWSVSNDSSVPSQLAFFISQSITGQGDSVEKTGYITVGNRTGVNAAAADLAYSSGDTLSFAYYNDTVYIGNITQGTYITFDNSASTYQQKITNNNALQSPNNAYNPWVWVGNPARITLSNAQFGSLDGLGIPEGQELDIIALVTTGRALLVPEPATATLSLLALAGLAARRRRK